MPAEEAVRSRVARRLGSDIVLTPSVFVGLGGVWMVVTPIVIDHGVYPWWSDVAAGAMLLALSVLQVARPGRSARLSMVAALVGAWLIASPFALGFHDQLGVAWNDMIIGTLVVLLSVVNAITAHPRSR
ncbi:SPW repeat protein [Actinoplanes solisilvae]|uniref:SPW repeat protein n=1 Tax=Actinoplanes solisilvae TaxID=2486853 RepID=UPI000FDA0373|nr:SPW repeat protein [Actinoplanes solisilvae]